jgi:hypothetical protein
MQATRVRAMNLREDDAYASIAASLAMPTLTDVSDNQTLVRTAIGGMDLEEVQHRLGKLVETRHLCGFTDEDRERYGVLSLQEAELLTGLILERTAARLLHDTLRRSGRVLF